MDRVSIAAAFDPLPQSVPGSAPVIRRAIPGYRIGLGLSWAIGGPLLVTALLKLTGAWVGLSVQTLTFLVTVIVASLIGGLAPALLCAIVGTTLLNYYFVPPLHTLRVGEVHNVLTLIVFIVVALLVGAVVHRAATMTARAGRAAAEARILAAIASAGPYRDRALPTLLEQIRNAFGMTSASILAARSAQPRSTVEMAAEVTGPERKAAGEDAPDETEWVLEHTCGAEPPQSPQEADVRMPLGQGRILALSGRALIAADRKILTAFISQAGSLLERDRLAAEAAQAEQLKATDRLREALLAAVGHDLRTPLASASAAVDSLRSRDIQWTPQERDELLATAEVSLHRLSHLVADLLDLSRLSAGALAVSAEPFWFDDLIPPALNELGPPAATVRIDSPQDLGPALGDPALVTRALVNVIGNAVRHSPTQRPPTAQVRQAGDTIQVRIVDHGPGIPMADRERVFIPFQRLGDTDNKAGLGLGLALSRGLLQAMGGGLEPEDTPGGGLTMVLTMPAVVAGSDTDTPEPGQRERFGG